MRNEIVLWDLSTGEALLHIPCLPDVDIRDLAFHPTIPMQAISTWGDSVRLWDLTTGESIRDYPLAEPHELAFTPDGRYIVATTAPLGFVILAVETGDEVGQVEYHDGPLGFVAVSPDGQTIVYANAAHELILYNWVTAKTTLTLGGHEDQVQCFDFSPDGQLGVSGAMMAIRLSGTSQLVKSSDALPIVAASSA